MTDFDLDSMTEEGLRIRLASLAAEAERIHKVVMENTKEFNETAAALMKKMGDETSQT